MPKDPQIPRFPEPPLETGVAQYPTPLVPNYTDKKGGWGLSDQGHIILLEKINIEKGTFAPLPTDGSITYTGRDANKWPSPLYLVAERPTEDGKFCIRFWANARSASSQNKWNYNISFSSEHHNYPILSRTYVVLRSDFVIYQGDQQLADFVLPLLSSDPLVSGALLVKQEMSELPDENPLRSLFVSVKAIYEKLPGPVLSGQKLDSRGDLENFNKQTVVYGTAAEPDAFLVTETKVEPIDSAKSVKTYSTVSSYAQLTSPSYSPGLLGIKSTSDNMVTPGTTPDGFVNGAGQSYASVIESKVEQITATKAKKTTVYSTGPYELDGAQNKPGLLGRTTKAESVVAYNSDADLPTVNTSGASVVESSVEPINTVQSKKTTISSFGPYTLSGLGTKSGLLGNTLETKSVVVSGAAADATSINLSGSSVLESQIKPIDSVKSEKTTITSTGPYTISGAEKKQGLLGEVTVNESIVAAGATPDALTTSVVSSEITPIDAVKSKKKTITSSGPSTLSGSGTKSGLMGATSVSESIVSSTQAADSATLNLSGSSVIQSDVQPIDSAKSKKTTISTSGPYVLAGSGTKSGLLGTTSVSESIVSNSATADPVTLNLSGSSTVQSSVEPIDGTKSKKTTVASSGPYSLSGAESKNGLMGNASQQKNVVAASSSPDAVGLCSGSITFPACVAIPAGGSAYRPSLNGRQISITPGSGVTTTYNLGYFLFPTQPVSQSDCSLTADQVAALFISVCYNTLGITLGNAGGGVVNFSGVLIYSPDNLTPCTTSIVEESAVTPIDATKSEKNTISATGPYTLSGYSKKPGLLGESQEQKYIVGSNTQPDALSTTIIESKVDPINPSISQKTTVVSTGPNALSGYATNPGLLGSTLETQSIVDVNSPADSLSLNFVTSSVVSSKIDPIDSAKSKKSTITTTGPYSLSAVENKSGLLGTTSTTESIVAYGAPADEVSSTFDGSGVYSSGTIQSEVTPIDSFKSKKTTITSSGPSELDGYSFNEYGALQKTAQTIVGPSTTPDLTGLVVKDVITPIDTTKSQRERTVMQSHPPSVTLYEITKDRAVIQNVIQYLLRSELTTPVIANNIVDVSDTDIGFPWVKRTTKQLPLDGSNNVILPPSRTEFKTITYTFPGIIYTWKASQTNDQARANLSFFNNRYPISMTVAAKHVITYSVAEPDLSTLSFFKVVTRPWAKIFFGLPDNTIHPPAPVNLSKQSVTKGNVAFDISGGQASNPSSYIPGQEILIGGDVDQWYGDIFVQTLIYVKEPPGSL